MELNFYWKFIKIRAVKTTHNTICTNSCVDNFYHNKRIDKFKNIYPWPLNGECIQINTEIYSLWQITYPTKIEISEYYDLNTINWYTCIRMMRWNMIISACRVYDWWWSLIGCVSTHNWGSAEGEMSVTCCRWTKPSGVLRGGHDYHYEKTVEAYFPWLSLLNCMVWSPL